MPGPGVQVLQTSPQTLPWQGPIGSGSGSGASPEHKGSDMLHLPSISQYSITAGQTVPVQVLQASPQTLPSQGLVGSGFGSPSQTGARMVHSPSWLQNFMTAGQAMPGGQGVVQASPQTLPSQGLVGSGSGSPSQTGARMEHSPSWLQNFMTAGHAMPGGQGVVQASPQTLPSQGSAGSSHTRWVHIQRPRSVHVQELQSTWRVSPGLQRSRSDRSPAPIFVASCAVS